jgi:hypothetical protein
MLNLSFYSDDWSGYARLLRDKQARETPQAHCAEEAPCLPTTAEINLNEKTNFNLYSTNSYKFYEKSLAKIL